MTMRQFRGSLWMKSITEAMDNLREVETDGPYGILSGCKSEVFLERDSFNELVHDVGAVVTYNPNWCDEHPQVGEAYFYRHGYKFFCLWDKKGA